MRRVIKNGKRINSKAQQTIDELERDMKREGRLSMIQMLIPLGMKAVEEELQREIRELVGERYSRGGEFKRWGKNPGSIFLGDQKVKVPVSRVRNVSTNEEVQLESYERLQSLQVVDDMALSRVIHGMSQRNYEQAAIQVPETFGIKKTSINRRSLIVSENNDRRAGFLFGVAQAKSRALATSYKASPVHSSEGIIFCLSSRAL